jgi:hypothetical protein
VSAVLSLLVRVKTVDLKWSFVGKVKDLYEELWPPNHYSSPNAKLAGWGLYMFVANGSKEARYIGQAFDGSMLSLQKKVRWEIIKDDNCYNPSNFNEKCRVGRVNPFELSLKVAHLENPQVDGIGINLETMAFWDAKKFLNSIEGALIILLVSAGNHMINKTWAKSYNLGPVKIFNSGDFVPLQPELSIPELQINLARSSSNFAQRTQNPILA